MEVAHLFSVLICLCSKGGQAAHLQIADVKEMALELGTKAASASAQA